MTIGDAERRTTLPNLRHPPSYEINEQSLRLEPVQSRAAPLMARALSGESRRKNRSPTALDGTFPPFQDLVSLDRDANCREHQPRWYRRFARNNEGSMAALTLLRSGSRLSDPRQQVLLLESHQQTPGFRDVLASCGHDALQVHGISVLQVNVGKVCNQTCSHCHVDAGPDRRESMSAAVAEACLSLLQRSQIPTLDITGGAPEMSPQFRRLVAGGRGLGCRVIDRCNLTILVAAGYTDLPEFLAEHQVEIVASLPCYLEANVDKQRGDRVFERSLEALRRLNALGYGLPDSHLTLTLVYNPTGYSFPPPQEQLEGDYRRELRSRYGIEFTRLFTITNMPISRFLADLCEGGRYESYMRKLVEAFNPATIEGLMCRSMLSVDWQGKLFDCDFNQMLDLGIASRRVTNVLELDDQSLAELHSRMIVTGRHCFGCTAGAGSSCSGSLEQRNPDEI